jgi:hypothetical protein
MVVGLALFRVAPKNPLLHKILYGGVPPLTFIVIVDVETFGLQLMLKGTIVRISHSLVAVTRTQGFVEIQVGQSVWMVSVAPTDE